MSEVCLETEVAPAEPVTLLPLEEYDKVIVSESGGKDSLGGCLFYALDLGIPPEKIELWHQCVDGAGEQHVDLMDWPCTESYIEAIGQHFGIQTAYQWRAGGIYGELMRKESLTGDVYYYNDQGHVVHLPTRRGKLSTRLKWPALSPDLRTRWCSAYVKIDVFRRVLVHDPRFKGTKEKPMKILVMTGERREESANRARYLEVERHACDSPTRLVHAWRPVIDWSERDIWDQYEKRRFLPHPAYLLGWNRTSCFGCIFSTKDLWAMMREIAPQRFAELVRIEKEIGHTIDPKLTLEQKADLGSLDRLPKDARLSKWVEMALSRSFTKNDLIMDRFELPAGAMRGAAGGPM